MVLSTKTHGNLDLAVAALLVALPWPLGLVAAGAAGWVPVIVGGVILANTLLTDFERGFARRIQIPLHLWIDGGAGLLLALSPWLFSFDATMWIFHVLAGIGLMAVAFITHTVPGYDRRAPRTPAPE